MARAGNRLDDYRRKRDFGSTSEPKGARAKQRRAGKPIFVVQLHHASARHFDFRLELGGTLRSWAVPKGPSRDPGVKRLAVQVEDHPLDYATFEGSIPAGSYGAGVVEIWDHGHWTSDSDAAQALDKGHLHFTLFGDRLNGDWSLVRTGRGKQWLLIKVKDEYAVKDDDATAPSDAPQRKPPAPKREGMTIPTPQLATLAERAPSRGEWVNEVKYDGYRVLLTKHRRQIAIHSRNRQNWTRELAHVAAAVAALKAESCVLDGELVVWDDAGHSSFGALQQAFGGSGVRRAEVMCFDLLELDGKDLRDRPFRERRQALERLLKKAKRPLRLSQVIEGPPREVRDAACKHGLEGIIIKDADAPYRGGRNRHWLKLKCIAGDEFLAIGFTPGKGARESLGSLLLAERRDGEWHYSGRAGSGLDDDTIARLGRLATRKKAPDDIRGLPTRAQLRGAKPQWFAQRPVVEVAFRARTRDGFLRQPAVKGVRLDKTAATLRDQPGDRADRSSNVLTHPEKKLFTDPPLTKAQLAEYYRTVAPWLLPEGGERPISLLRCPDGIAGECFFQKHGGSGLPQGVHTIDIADKRGDNDSYLWVDSADGLAGLVQLGTIELHAWGCRVGDIEHPDRIVFDLDPAEGVAWEETKNAARVVRERLASIGLESWLRTSGGKGLHVVVAIKPGPDWDTVKEFAHGVAVALSQEAPKKFLATATKSKRKGRIFIDYLRNGRGATAIVNYSVRARAGAGVATPLRWDELARLSAPDYYTVANIPRRLAQIKKDPWAGIARSARRLPKV